ncbi:MAG: 2-hydroxy-4-carboxymuconate semialdehyde hemiacetal dehydrogenase [Bacteroidota bacterium]|jgi:predicted dehydrogenase
MKRRKFISNSLILGSTAAVFPNIVIGQKEEQKKVRLGFIGVGNRGQSHLEMAMYRQDVEIIAICDIDPKAIAISQDMIAKKGRKPAAVYQKGEHDFENLVKRDDIDGVVIATPWEWHVPMALASMKAGKYTGVEVSATVTLQESWDLVNMYEKTGSHCMILENVCYRRDVMAVLNMVRQGMFGSLSHVQCGYQHDLRDVKFNDGVHTHGGGVEFGEKGFSEAKWRTQHSIDRNGDIYPTHGLGPVAEILNINRGNQFLYLTSMASLSQGLHDYIVKKGGPNHPNAKVKFKLGDIVQTMIKCANGETILITHDTNLPRPYSLGFRVQGTNGLWTEDNKSIYLESTSTKPHRWEEFKLYQDKYDHPLWLNHAADAENAGHGGIDYFVLRAFIESIKNKVAPPIDVYDAAAWSAISPLSEESIKKGSAPIQIPDFTRGKWKTNKPIFGLTNDY